MVCSVVRTPPELLKLLCNIHLPPLTNTGQATRRLESYLDLATILWRLLQICKDVDSPRRCRFQNYQHSRIQLGKYIFSSQRFVVNFLSLLWLPEVLIASFPSVPCWPFAIFLLTLWNGFWLIKLTIDSFFALMFDSLNGVSPTTDRCSPVVSQLAFMPPIQPKHVITSHSTAIVKWLYLTATSSWKNTSIWQSKITPTWKH